MKYPSIEQFRHAVKSLTLRDQYIGKDENGNAIYDPEKPLSTDIEFEGTVKLHGTNASFIFEGDSIKYQSRSGEISPLKDNAGFATFYSSSDRVEKLKGINKSFRDANNIPSDVVLGFFGEWCGGNIQKGVGLNQLSKRFVLFGVKQFVDEDTAIWYPFEGVSDHSMEFYNIKDYETFKVSLDLNDPSKALAEINKLTDAVEAECPFCKAFGINNSVGEGIVWETTLPDGTNIRFKSKGEKHSVVGKSPKNPLEPEKLEGISSFVDYTVTENRLNQAIEQVFTTQSEDPDIKKTGVFLKWLVEDILKEELDTLVESGLTAKEVQGEISKRGRTWFIDYLDKSLGIKR
jgi:hypothetical protein